MFGSDDLHAIFLKGLGNDLRAYIYRGCGPLGQSSEKELARALRAGAEKCHSMRHQAHAGHSGGDESLFRPVVQRMILRRLRKIPGVRGSSVARFLFRGVSMACFFILVGFIWIMSTVTKKAGKIASEHPEATKEVAKQAAGFIIRSLRK